MEITYKFLRENKACSDGMEFVLNNIPDCTELTEFIKLLTDENLNWQNWLISRLLSKDDCVRYAIYAAEKVLPIFTDKYPNDDRPVKAIQAAKDYLKNHNADAAVTYDAAVVTYDAAIAAYKAAIAAYAAADAAFYAIAIADAAYYAAAAIAAAAAAIADAAYYAADAAAAAAFYADAADGAAAAADGYLKDIIRFGLNLIKKMDKLEGRK